MASFVSEIKKIGGFSKVQELFRNGSFGTVVAEVLLLGKSRKALEIANLASQLKIHKKISKKYKKMIDAPKTANNAAINKTVWLCWLQGMENAPYLVQKCYQSVKQQFNDWNVIVITNDNLREYTMFPEYIISKYNLGVISKTHFSDLLRIELLSRHGGLWIDATVYCTGTLSEDVLSSDFFVFQSMKPGHTGHTVRASSWLMWSKPRSYFIEQTKKLLWEYWKIENRLIDYFLLHHFITLIMDCYPDEALKILPDSNVEPHILLLRLFEKYDENVWNYIKKQSDFHKLTYKFKDGEATKLKNTYYSILFDERN